MNIILLSIFGVAGLMVVGVMLLLIFVRPKKKVLSKVVFQKYWSKIQVLIASENIFEAKQAVVEADKLLDMILKERVSGKDLGGRLRNAEALFGRGESYQQLWEAHKFRNRLVHEVGFETNLAKCQQTVNKFRQGFRKLGY